ncbi:methyltransferase domain-containing protein [archaeon]|jgi:SAM-dependent methyltransferase|nr:methyltransferase domain-containing protein [archaeon]
MPEYNIMEEAGLSQIKARGRKEQSEEDIKVAERLDFSFYDGSREKGFGGYYYDGRWRRVAEIIKKRYGLHSGSKVLIDRCHKGFLVYDLMKLIPGIEVWGIHPSSYPLNHTMEGYGRWVLINGVEKGDSEVIEKKACDEVMPFLIKADNLNLPFKDDYFDCVISIENVCAFFPEDSVEVLRELVRVAKNNGKSSYIQNDSWRNEYEEGKLRAWTLLCKDLRGIDEWIKLYSEVGFEGDYGWTVIV